MGGWVGGWVEGKEEEEDGWVGGLFTYLVSCADRPHPYDGLDVKGVGGGLVGGVGGDGPKELHPGSMTFLSCWGGGGGGYGGIEERKGGGTPPGRCQ